MAANDKHTYLISWNDSTRDTELNKVPDTLAKVIRDFLVIVNLRVADPVKEEAQISEAKVATLPNPNFRVNSTPRREDTFKIKELTSKLANLHSKHRWLKAKFQEVRQNYRNDDSDSGIGWGRERYSSPVRQQKARSELIYSRREASISKGSELDTQDGKLNKKERRPRADSPWRRRSCTRPGCNECKKQSWTPQGTPFPEERLFEDVQKAKETIPVEQLSSI